MIRTAAVVLVLVLVTLFGCESEKEQELRFIKKELVDLKAAVAKRDIVRMTTGCAVTSVFSGDPAALAAEISQLCDVEVPRIILEDAIADVTKDLKAGTEPFIACAQLFVKEAFDALERKPPGDPGVRKLADEYKRLCPMPPLGAAKKPL